MFGLAGRLQRQGQIEGLSEGRLQRGSSFVPRNHPPQHAFQRGRALAHPVADPGSHGVIREGQRLADAADVAPQRQAAMLQDPVVLAHLGAADQLAAVGGDLVIGGNFKTHGAFSALRNLLQPFIRLRFQPQPFQREQQRLTQVAVAGHDVPAHQRVFSGQGHAVSDFVRVQDGAPPGGPPHDAPTIGQDALQVSIGGGLGLPQRKAGGLPGEKAQGGRRKFRANLFQNGLVQRHVIRAIAVRGDQQTPLVGCKSHRAAVLSCTRPILTCPARAATQFGLRRFDPWLRDRLQLHTDRMIVWIMGV